MRDTVLQRHLALVVSLFVASIGATDLALLFRAHLGLTSTIAFAVLAIMPWMTFSKAEPRAALADD
jgi:hypothetical protein